MTSTYPTEVEARAAAGQLTDDLAAAQAAEAETIAAVATIERRAATGDETLDITEQHRAGLAQTRAVNRRTEVQAALARAETGIAAARAADAEREAADLAAGPLHQTMTGALAELAAAEKTYVAARVAWDRELVRIAQRLAVAGSDTVLAPYRWREDGADPGRVRGFELGGRSFVTGDREPRPPVVVPAPAAPSTRTLRPVADRSYEKWARMAAASPQMAADEARMQRQFDAEFEADRAREGRPAFDLQARRS